MDAGRRKGTRPGQDARRPGVTRTAPLVLAAAALLPALPAMAQQEPNPLLTFSFSSSLNVSDNYDMSVEKPGTTTFLDNRLGLSYVSETAEQLLSIGGSGVFRLADLPESGSEASFDDQTLRFDYRRFGAASELALRGRYNRAELAFFDPLSLMDEIYDVDTGDLLNNPDGARETMSLGISYDTDPDAPLSFSFSADTYRRNFTGISDSEYYDTENHSVSGSVGMLVAPTTRVFVNGAVRQRKTDDVDNMERLDQSASLGLRHEMARGLTFNGSLGYQKVETDRTDIFGQRGTETHDGLTGVFGATQDLTNGTLGAQLVHSVTATGARNEVQVSRALELPEGDLALMAGVSKGDAGKASFIGNVSYNHELTDGSIFLGLSRSVQTNDDDEDTTQTRAQASWTRNLTAVSYARLSVDYTSIEAVGDGSEDRQRGRLRASYNHELTADWEVSGGYEYAFSHREDRPDADENLVFLTIGRDFQFRP